MSPVLIEKLQLLRDNYGKPIVINSGCRCHKHNQDVGGVFDSAHIATDTEPCEAVDVKIVDGREAFKLVGLSYMFKLFKRVFVEAGCVHFDVDETKPQPWLGVYRAGGR